MTDTDLDGVIDEKDLGERSGSGFCFVQSNSAADGWIYTISSNIHLINAAWEDIDAGVPVSAELVTGSVDGTRDYSAFFDFDRIREIHPLTTGVKWREPSYRPIIIAGLCEVDSNWVLHNSNWTGKMSIFISSRGYHTEVIGVDNIIRYLAAMTLANKMLDDSKFTRRECLAFEERMCEKYELPECSLYRKGPAIPRQTNCLRNLLDWRI